MVDLICPLNIGNQTEECFVYGPGIVRCFFYQEYGMILFCSLLLLCSSIWIMSSTLYALNGNHFDNNLSFDFSGTELKVESS